MRISDIPEIDKLTIPEKIILVEEIWDSISLDEPNIPIPQSHIEELNKRLTHYNSDPGILLSLEDLQVRIENRK